MTPFTDEPCVLTMPLTLKAHHVANQFRAQQSNIQKAKQVYLNTLAVQVVQSYLTWFGIETDLTASDSWNPTLQSLSDTADLVIKGKGRVECRPVLPNDTRCHIPPEIWSDRIGYVAVQFNSELTEATLLGFVPHTTTAEVPLNQLRSLDDFLDLLSLPEQPEAIEQPIPLSQWLQGVVEAGWQTIDELLGLQQPTWSFRSGNQGLPVHQPSLQRGKLLQLTPPSNQDPLALLIGLQPIAESMFDVWVTLCPTENRPHLPPDVELVVLDEFGVAVMHALSRQTEIIQLQFKGVLGEKFSIRVNSGTDSITEACVI